MAEDGVIRKPERDHSIDVAKGLGILLVLAYHVFLFPELAQNAFTLFLVPAMPFFFMISGYFYKPGKRKPGENILRRTKTLLKVTLEYFAGMFVLSVIWHLIRGTFNFEDMWIQLYEGVIRKEGVAAFGLTWKDYGFSVHLYQITYTYWFVFGMFFGDIIFYLVVDFALKSKESFLFVLVSLIGLSGVLLVAGVQLPWFLQNTFVYAAISLVGAALGKVGFLKKAYAGWVRNLVILLLILATMALIELNFKMLGVLSGGTTPFGVADYFFAVIFGVFGVYMYVLFGKVICKVKWLEKIFTWFGQRSLSLLLVHYLPAAVMYELFGIAVPLTFLGLKPGPFDGLILFFSITAIFVVYRFAWEFILRKIYAKKLAKAKA